MRKTATILLFLIATHTTLNAAIFLNGAGATFPSELYKKWFNIYRQITGVHMNYQANGSGKGVQLLLNKKIDFCGSDVFLTNKKMAKSNAQLLHVPSCLGAVAITYNLPGRPKLQLNGKLLADIFRGKIRDWSHKSIKKINPHLKLNNLPITVIHRSDKSGTTHLFSSFLSKACKKWKKELGYNKLIRWPAGIGLNSNKNMAKFTKKINGSISYISLGYAIKHRLLTASIQNSSGFFIRPDYNSIKAAIPNTIPADGRVMLTNTPAPGGYPISAFSYLIFYKKMGASARSRAIKSFLQWALTKGQNYSKGLFFVPLPKWAANRALSILQKITYSTAGGTH